MPEKISESHIREEKVRKLKEKILEEIKKEQNVLRFMMTENNCDFDEYATKYYQLMQLKEYMESKAAFCQYEVYDENKDYVVYTVDSKLLDIWLQKKYNFALQFLHNLKRCPDELFETLNNDYFGHHFTNMYDIIAYDEKQEND